MQFANACTRTLTMVYSAPVLGTLSTSLPPLLAMVHTHNPATVVNALREIFVVDKLQIGFLLGAGCPSSIDDPNQSDAPLIPATDELTRAVIDNQPNTGLSDRLRRLQKMLIDDGEPSDVEQMLSRVRAMQGVVGNQKIRGFSKTALQNLEQAICKTISATVNVQLPTSWTPYHSLAKWIGQRTNRTTVFTTNYDLLIEQALETLQVPFFDGFVGSYRPFFNQQAMEPANLPKRWTLVCKLHGSINWRRIGEGNTIVRDMGDGKELLIHPSHLKYTESRRMPYFVMLDQLKAFLGEGKKPVVLFAIGYSFSDQHVNAVIEDGLRANPSSVCYALQYKELSTHSEIDSLVQRCSNLNVLARDAAITGGQRSKWAKCSQALVDELDGAFCPRASQEPSDDKASEDGDAEVDVECRLGDFDAFGDFLATFAPSRRLYMEEPEE